MSAKARLGRARKGRLSRLLVAGVLALGGLGIAAIVVSVDRGERSRTFVAGSEEFVANSLDELSAASDAVVEATVLAVGPGREVDLGEGNILEFERATLRVDRILDGDVVGDVVLVEEYYNTLQWPWKEGGSGIFFLHLKDQPLKEPIYRLTSSQGRFDMGESSVEGSNDAEDWVKELENLTPAEFEAAVEEAVQEEPPGE